MKFDQFKLIIIAVLGVLLAWGYSELCTNREMALPMFIVIVAIMICCAIGYSLKNVEYPRASFNARMVVSLFVGALLIFNVIFCFVPSFSFPIFIIPNVGIILVGMLVYRSIFCSKV